MATRQPNPTKTNFNNLPTSDRKRFSMKLDSSFKTLYDCESDAGWFLSLKIVNMYYKTSSQSFFEWS